MTVNFIWLRTLLPPYEYVEGGKIVGLDPMMATAICDKLGKKLVIDDMEFDSVITAVQTGKDDFGMAGMTDTPERRKNIDFSTSYANTTQVKRQCVGQFVRQSR